MEPRPLTEEFIFEWVGDFSEDCRDVVEPLRNDDLESEVMLAAREEDFREKMPILLLFAMR